MWIPGPRLIIPENSFRRFEPVYSSPNRPLVRKCSGVGRGDQSIGGERDAVYLSAIPNLHASYRREVYVMGMGLRAARQSRKQGFNVMGASSISARWFQDEEGYCNNVTKKYHTK